MTIGRAYRHLADAGVINVADVADRRCSRVAGGDDIASGRLLSAVALRAAG
jgi:hypothetical protein